MAIDYAKLFAPIGEYVQRVNDYETYMSDIDTDFAEIKADLDTAGRDDVLEGEFTEFEASKGVILSWIQRMGGKIEQLLTNKEAVLDELVTGSASSLGEIWDRFYRQMVADAESITANTVTVGSVTGVKVNTDAGTVVVDKYLDGVSAPTFNGFPVPSYSGIASQLTIGETQRVTCISDSFSGGSDEGAEQFSWVGGATYGEPYGTQSYGSGDGPTLTALQGSSVLPSCDFETFTGDVPDGWTLDTGTATTHVQDETTIVAHGSASLKLIGNGVLATIQLSQDATGLTPMARYCVAFYCRKATSATGTLEIKLEGTGYSAGTEKISFDVSTLSTSAWTLKTAFISVPAELPSDLKLVIELSGTPNNAIYVDWGGIVQCSYLNGVTAVVVAGTDKFVQGDSYTYDVSNSENGVFQTAFAKLFGLQLPSSGSPTRADSLCT